MLRTLDHLPVGLLDCPAPDLVQHLEGPTLIHLAGQRPRPLFLSVLLHGNEVTGWEAVRGLLKDFTEVPLPRALSIFIGNVQAANAGVRRFDGQPDYNRIWTPGETPEHQMAHDVLDIMRRLEPFAGIDVHNTTGPNPHYACINRLNNASLYLARRFSRTAVYFRAPFGMMSMALNDFCPAVTLECGLPGDPAGVVHAKAYLEQRLFEESLPDRAPAADELDLFHTTARVLVPSEVSFDFQDAQVDLCLEDDLVQYNFRELPAGHCLGTWREGRSQRLHVTNEDNVDVFDTYFTNHNNQLLVRQPFMLSMLTTQKKIVEQDCLCYVMERMTLG